MKWKWVINVYFGTLNSMSLSNAICFFVRYFNEQCFTCNVFCFHLWFEVNSVAPRSPNRRAIEISSSTVPICNSSVTNFGCNLRWRTLQKMNQTPWALSGARWIWRIWNNDQSVSLNLTYHVAHNRIASYVISRNKREWKRFGESGSASLSHSPPHRFLCKNVINRCGFSRFSFFLSTKLGYWDLFIVCIVLPPSIFRRFAGNSIFHTIHRRMPFGNRTAPRW